MKHFFPIAAVAAVGLAADNVWAHGNGNNSSGSSAPVAHHSSSAPATTAAVAPRFNGGAMPHYARSTSYRPAITYPNGNRTLNYPAVSGSTTVHRSTHSDLNNLNTLQRNGGNLQHTAALNVVGKNRLDPKTSAHLRNWSGNVSTSTKAHQNHLNNCNHHHNNWWWRNRCAAFIFFDWGWWGWYDGWWYPAWGYDPYSYYPYNEPIYGYDGLSPEQVIAGVQVALQQRGYYTYEIDGRMGPLTRAAIARYQSDHRLPITSGIDAATLGSLGVIR